MKNSKQIKPLVKKSKKPVDKKQNNNNHQQQQQHQHGLLTYCYFLNTVCSKFISIGFENVNFMPLIQLGKIGKSELNWNILDWITFTTHASSIQDYLNNSNNSLNISFTNFIMSSTNEKIVIKNKTTGEEIDLSVEEITTILNFMDFFNTIIFHYKSCTIYVQEYYNQYVANCSIKNVFSLNTMDYFIPPNDRYHLNYYRLFYEIPVLCKSKLLFDVMNNMLLSEIENKK